MRSLLFLFAFSLYTAGVKAQHIIGSLEKIYASGGVSMTINYTNAAIHGMSEDDFSYYEEDWEKDKNKVYEAFVSGVEDVFENTFYVGKNIKSNYRMVIDVKRIQCNGSFVFDALFYDSQDKLVASIIGCTAKGGKFGSKMNLIKDGAENSGKRLAKVIRRNKSHKAYQM